MRSSPPALARPLLRVVRRCGLGATLASAACAVAAQLWPFASAWSRRGQLGRSRGCVLALTPNGRLASRARGDRCPVASCRLGMPSPSAGPPLPPCSARPLPPVEAAARLTRVPLRRPQPVAATLRRGGGHAPAHARRAVPCPAPPCRPCLSSCILGLERSCPASAASTGQHVGAGRVRPTRSTINDSRSCARPVPTLALPSLILPCPAHLACLAWLA